MSPELREALRGLCRSHGWSTGAFWRLDRRDPRLLVMEESFYEEHIGAEIDRIITHVHVVGEGHIGAAALSGKHQWIYSDTYCINPCRNEEIFKGIDEMQRQFSAGMKTIAIVPLLSFGVAQFGSAQKISESLEFVYQVQQLFRQMDPVTGHFSSELASFNSISSLHDVISRELQADVQSSATATLWPIDPYSSTMPAAVTLTGASYGFGNSLQKMPTPRNQYGASSADHHAILKQFTYSFSSSSSSSGFDANNWVKEIATVLSVPEERSLPVSVCSPCRPQDVIYGSGKVLDRQHSSSSWSSPFQLDCPSTSKSSSRSLSFPSDLPDSFLATPPDLAPEPSLLPKFKDYLPDPCEPSPDCSPSNNLHTAPAEECPENTGGEENECSTAVPEQLVSDSDLFEGMELDLNPKGFRKECWDDLVIPFDNEASSNFGKSMSDGISDLDMASIAVADKSLFSESSFEQLLEAVVGGSANLSSSPSSMPNNTVTYINSLDLEHRLSALARADPPQVCRDQAALLKHEEKIMKGPSKEASLFAEEIGSWLDDGCSMNAESFVTNQPKKPDETAKVAKKRARPGESTRPRPKDRQQIQDRVKELREIVPNSSKCSIDSLLGRTIKHMLFLQNVTKYADKLKHTDEPKMIGDESGVVLKDNSGSGCTGATWAYEVAGRTMVCPILVEDLNPPGQMLVEMLCEEQGFFLEIADIIRGFGLTILKGVMEIRDSKIWTRFLVEANKDVTRMDIFLSLVQLSQQTSSIRSQEQKIKDQADRGVSTPFANYQPSPVSVPIGLADGLQ